MELIFSKYTPKKPKLYTWKVPLPMEFAQGVREELVKLYGEDVKYGIDTHVTVEVFGNEDDTNLTYEQVMDIFSPNPPEKLIDILKTD